MESNGLRYYKAAFLMRKTDPLTLSITDIWHFRSAKTNKRYIVEVEYFSNHFFGLKFYWKGVVESRQRYSLMTNDYEPRSIVMSCVHIMLYFFSNDKCASFGFVAAPNQNDSDKSTAINKRFRFYRRMMLSLFSPDAFVQAYDKNNSVYVLINRAMLSSNCVSIEMIEREL